MSRKDTLFDESLYKNMGTYYTYFNELSELAMSMFEWINLPPEIDPRFLELALLTKGYALFFKDDGLMDEYGRGGYLAMTCTLSAPFDIYRVPMTRRAFASNGYHAMRNNKDSVIIYNNMLRTCDLFDVQMYAERLYQYDRIIDININAQKTPVILQGTENQQLTLKNLYMKYDGNQPFIFGDKSFDINNAMKALNTSAPFVADKIYELKTKMWNEALTRFGIANVTEQKKERMITDEVNRGQGGIIACRQSKLNARKNACRQINEMFGLNIDCQFKDFDSEVVECPNTQSN